MSTQLKGAGSTTVGPEMVQIQAIAQIIDNLPDQLQLQARYWNNVDKRFAEKLGLPYKPTTLEQPKNSSYYSGTRAGVLGLPWDRFPIVAVMADSGAAASDSGSTTGASHFNLSLYIESVVRSDSFPFTDPDGNPEEQVERIYQEGVVDRRAKRMLEALIQSIAINPSLDGLIPRLPDPRWAQTDPFMLTGTTPDNQSSKMVFSLVRIEYTPDVFASWPSDSGLQPPVLSSGFGT